MVISVDGNWTSPRDAQFRKAPSPISLMYGGRSASASALQPSNAEAPIVSRLLGKLISGRDVQSLNALLPRVDRSCGSVTDSRPVQPWKIPEGRDVIRFSSGKVTLPRPLQFRNAFVPMDDTDPGISRSPLIPLPLNAELPIFVSPSPRTTSVHAEQFANALLPIEVTFSRLISCRPVQPENALSGMDFRPLPSSICCSVLQPLKLSEPMLVTVSARVTEVRFGYGVVEPVAPRNEYGTCVTPSSTMIEVISLRRLYHGALL